MVTHIIVVGEVGGEPFDRLFVAFVEFCDLRVAEVSCVVLGETGVTWRLICPAANALEPLRA
jgi:hypothetical protein